MSKLVASDDLIAIGKIIGVHGLKGNLKVYSYAESLETYRSETKLTVRDTNDNDTCYRIARIKVHKRQLFLLSLDGICTREQARSLTGSKIFIKQANLPELEEGIYYWSDLIGLSVVTITDKYLGRIETIMQTGANDVYVVKSDGNHPIKETLIPALESVVQSVDLKQRTMIVDLPEGL
ncbi:ribosome maturation factor RimM [Desulfococcaceae bacterium HSG7]|nr:ribosome maturation factor RimM [Desulfococcaceae bacterium HSG9]MDM8554771.1 ribosome maturation factor RimM [Desulfococcaceae bacterium HSG7]